VIGVGHVRPHKTNLLCPETPGNTWKHLETPGNTWKQQNDQPARGWISFHRHANIEQYRYRKKMNFYTHSKPPLTRRMGNKRERERDRQRERERDRDNK
jgi:hypothetical protein